MKQKPGICVVPIVVIGALSSFIIYYQTQNSRLAAALLALTALGGIHAYLQFRRQQAEFVEMLQVQQASMSALVDLAQLRDEEVTGRHLNRLGFYAAILTKELGLPPDLQENIAKTIALHDIGKVAVPDYILNKPGPLNQEEWALIQQHPLTGASVLDSITADINVSNTKIADYLTIGGGLRQFP
ncbi:MAG TPA: HD domain-containing protein, partial [Firmicutes bacterium]|nr:HD domain-containing protein [Bacillota bacterium]